MNGKAGKDVNRPLEHTLDHIEFDINRRIRDSQKQLDDGTITSGVANLSTGIEPFLGDSTLNISILNALDSIHRTWMETQNHAPLSSNKEERIKQAVYFMITEEQNRLRDNSIKKHSYRQVSLYFKIPKSTLYDRLKYKNVANVDNGTTTEIPNEIRYKTKHGFDGSHSKSAFNNEMEKDGSQNAFVNSGIGDLNHEYNSKSYRKQMKITPDKEKQLIDNVRLLCHAMGNIMNRTQIKACVKSLTDDIPLGKKWLQNFMNRHKDSVLYGIESGPIHVTTKNINNGRNNSAYLWKCFVALLQEKVKNLSRNQPFFYITRTCIHRQSRSSLFTCFKIDSSNYSIDLLFSPKVIIFPDYFNNRPYMNIQDSDNNILEHNMTHIDDISYNERLWKNKNGKLTKLLLDIINICSNYSSHGVSNTNEVHKKLPLVAFEGFDEQFNWDPIICDQISKSSTLLSVPWKEQLFQEITYSETNQKITKYIDDMSNKSQHELPLEFEVNDIDLNLKVLQQAFTKLMESKLIDIDPNAQEHDKRDLSTNGEDYDKYYYNRKDNEVLDNNTYYNNIVDTDNGNSQYKKKENPIEGNIFENSMVSKLSDVVELVEQNESMLYDHITDASAKAIMKEIFNRMKKIIPQ